MLCPFPKQIYLLLLLLVLLTGLAVTAPCSQWTETNARVSRVDNTRAAIVTSDGVAGEVTALT